MHQHVDACAWWSMLCRFCAHTYRRNSTCNMQVPHCFVAMHMRVGYCQIAGKNAGQHRLDSGVVPKPKGKPKRGQGTKNNQAASTMCNVCQFPIRHPDDCTLCLEKILQSPRSTSTTDFSESLFSVSASAWSSSPQRSSTLGSGATGETVHTAHTARHTHTAHTALHTHTATKRATGSTLEETSVSLTLVSVGRLRK